MSYRILFICGLLYFVFCQIGLAQEFNVVSSTPTFTDYELVNDDMRIAPPFEITAPIENGSVRYKILEQDVSSVNEIVSKQKQIALTLSSSEKPLIETLFFGTFRGQNTASLKINVARSSDTYTLITKQLKIRVYKPTQTPAISGFANRYKAESHPFSSGTWYKIPVTRNGIYKIDSDYLSKLGLDVVSLDPRKLQIWKTNGYALAEENSKPRPEFVEAPILVEGEADGSFDAGDRLIFFGNSPHKVERYTANSYAHFLHPYSDSSYVYLTVGTNNGKRLNAANSGLTPSRTITTFNDFIWKDEELTKVEDGIKSGRYWLGQKIPAASRNKFISIYNDTLPGIVTDKPIQIESTIAGRALSTLYFEMELNNTYVNRVSVGRISDYNSAEEYAGKSSKISSSVTPAISNNMLELSLEMSGGDNECIGFVDWIRLTFERRLTAENNYLYFYSPFDNSDNEIGKYVLNGFSGKPYVMDVTNPNSPKLLETTPSGNDFTFNYNTAGNFQFIAQSVLFTPFPGRALANQNLHGITEYPDYIIVTSEYLKDYADELAATRKQGGLTPFVVTQNKIMEEFSGGALDPTAIRDFVKFLWDRAIQDGKVPPKYLLLFGDTTFDYKGILTNGYVNHVLTFESPESLHREDSYATDDFFGYMDNNEGLLTRNSSSARVDIGIGRVSAQTRSEAAIALNKIKTYENPVNDGDWQNLLTFAGDDDFPTASDRDIHTLNADGTVERMNLDKAGLRVKKIYTFSYPVEITGSGRQFPEATKDLLTTISNGTLVFNYSGHGGQQVLSDERLFMSDYIPNLTNKNKLAVIVTATCQFGRYDDSDSQSGAEKLVFADNGGGIAAFTTTRVVQTSGSTTSTNYGLNIQLSQKMIERDEYGEPLRLGDIFLRTKNTSLGNDLNTRKFILIGDPATKFALPNKKVVLTTINNIDITAADTTLLIKALDQVSIKGNITTQSGEFLSDYSGETTITVFDAPRTTKLPNDRTWVEEGYCYLPGCQYNVESDVLFKGKSAVRNGMFNLSFIIPKDISFSREKGRIVAFADNGEATAGGSFTNLIFDGINTEAVNDGKGPNMDIYLNDNSFANGSLVNDSPTLIIDLDDPSGINTTGTGVGHEIIATIDTKPQQTFILNNFYEGKIDDFTGGRIEYPLDNLPEGSYTLKVRAWDVHNNPTDKDIVFEVAQMDELSLKNIYNYPNPMNNRTSFTFEHNQPGNPLDVSIKIFTLSGRPVQHIQKSIITNSSYASISWNGRDRDNDRLGNGTYVYVLRVTADTPKGRKTIEKIEKLVIIR